jgi:hypothetical protein
MMAIKRTYGVAVLAGIATIPTFYFDVVCKDRFLRSYEDSGLLQTSELDGWNLDEATSMREREDFRRFLVDCHKASYIPICVSGEGNILTAEPAGKLSQHAKSTRCNSSGASLLTFLVYGCSTSCDTYRAR